MIVRNNTHYHFFWSRSYNFVPDTHSFQYESSRRRGYMQRLYYEFLYTQKVNGVAFFYTLTYNDRSIPKFLGHNVFDYNDIRYITNGSLSKTLKRKYGSRLRYYCACESGEGKGQRGIGNNPHYHFIFFVQPLHDSDGNPIYDTYKKILPNEFRSLIYTLWHGKTGFVPFQLAKYGIAKEGNNSGVVVNADAFSYVSKYCTKPSEFISIEEHVRKYYYKMALERGIDNLVLFSYYEYLIQHRPFSSLDKYEFFSDFRLHQFNQFRKSPQPYYNGPLTYTVFVNSGFDTDLKYRFSQLQDWYRERYIPEFVDKMVLDFNNRFSPKVRMSKNLGIFGLECLSYEGYNPIFKIPTKSGYSIQRPALFYIRQLYYDVSICEITGSPLYRLNERGKQWKLDTLESAIDTFANNVRSSLSFCIDNNLSESLLSSSILADINLDYKLKLYSIYNLVYRYRSYCEGIIPIHLTESLSIDDIKQDYSVFLNGSVSVFDYEASTILMVRPYQHYYTDFSLHPVFAPYIYNFKALDKIVDSVSFHKSELSKTDFSEKSLHLKRLNSYKFNCSI